MFFIKEENHIVQIDTATLLEIAIFDIGGTATSI
jgi:hypothetical protein